MSPLVAHAPRVTIAVATYNRAGLLRQTLERLVRQQYPAGHYEILVVDNNSSDDTAAVVASFAPHRPAPRYVHEPRQGLSCARNRAIAEARASEVIVFADDDVLVEPNWLTTLTAPFWMEHGSQIGAIGGEVIPVFTAELPRWISDWHGPLALRPDTGPLGPRQNPMGASLAIARSAIAKVGLFDETLGRNGRSLMGGEETEFLQRLRRSGFEIWFVPAAKALHQLPASRTTFRYAARHAFDSARSRVIEQGPRSPLFALSRLLGNALKAMAFFLLSILCALVLRTGDAKKALVRSWRCCGYLYQIPVTLFGTRHP